MQQPGQELALAYPRLNAPLYIVLSGHIAA
jgi:hypothetical protein